MKPVPQWDIEIILIGVVCFLGLLFWLGRSPSALRPTRLNLKARSSSEKELRPEEVPKGFRILNVVFVWNGHPWDAFEVLGVPAGSSLQEVETSYRDLVQKTDAQSRPFLDAAFTSILEEFRRSA
ncbi:MAG: J domain-containing protein [Bdellovibrio sp.]